MEHLCESWIPEPGEALQSALPTLPQRQLGPKSVSAAVSQAQRLSPQHESGPGQRPQAERDHRTGDVRPASGGSFFTPGPRVHRAPRRRDRPPRPSCSGSSADHVSLPALLQTQDGWTSRPPDASPHQQQSTSAACCHHCRCLCAREKQRPHLAGLAPHRQQPAQCCSGHTGHCAVFDAGALHHPQEGVVLNMRGVALRCVGNLQRAAESYQAAIDICQEYEDLQNWAVAQANLGLLCLKAGAKSLAMRHLTEAVQLFSELDGDGHQANFIAVLLQLGRLYIKQQQHQVQLLRCSGDRAQEGEALEAVSQLYLTLGTDRAYKAALDYTKTSLGIFIDLGCREKEAFGWLQAGKIYHLLGQTELVDLYVQDRALPIAVKSSSIHTRLRLCNKLTEVMLSLQLHGEAVEFAQTALDISMTQGESLNERVAYHRLAALYHRLGQYEFAEHYYLKALTLCPAPLQFDEEHCTTSGCTRHWGTSSSTT
ncbi:hypothetical protein INR49_011554 [Caranx melampygus]|nr:hypothetical protein INR49_011554 [Caranx melampygus]